MGKKLKPTPNTHLGAVTWYGDIFWGTYLWICQQMLGVTGKPDERFLNPEQQNVDTLREFFGDTKAPNGTLTLELYSDQNWHTLVLATIETTLPYGVRVKDQVFLNLVADFIEHVRNLPHAKPGEGAGTKEEIDAAFARGANDMKAIDKALRARAAQAGVRIKSPTKRR